MDTPPVPTNAPETGADSSTPVAGQSLSRRVFVNRLKATAVMAPIAIMAIAHLPKAAASY